MSDLRDDQRSVAGEPADEDADVARAVRLVARAPIAARRREAAYRRVHAEWRAALASATGSAPAAQRRPPWRTALAASVVVALIAIGLIGRGPAKPPQPMAVALTVAGSRASLQGPGVVERWLGRERSLLADTAVRIGDSLATGDDTAALLRVGAALMLRVAPGSHLRFDATDRVTLLRGQLYVDSGARDGRGAPLTVSTPYAEVRHVGTRYLVRLKPAALEVAVREGRVRVAPGIAGAGAEAVAGEALRVTSGSNAIERSRVATSGADWAWLDRVPAPVDIEGGTLTEFLSWYAAETGRSVVVGDVSGQNRLGGIRLSGSVAGLSPDEALDAVAAIADLSVRRGRDEVSVDAATR